MQVTKAIGIWFQGRRSAVPPDKRLSREAVVSLVIHSTFQFGASMSGVFLNLYLWRLTHSLWINGIYNIIVFAMSPLAFALGGWIAKKRDRLVTYRAGIALTAAFYLLVVAMQERVVDYYVLFALFGGLAGGFYWTGYLTLMYDVSTDRNRIRYLALNMMWFTAAGLVGPALAGFVISHTDGLRGYVAIFSLAFVMFLIAAIVSLRISSADSHHKRYYLKFGPLLMRKNKELVRGLLGFLTLGLLQGIMLFLPNILLFQAVPREDLVGYFGVLFSLITISTGFYIGKFAREAYARLYLLIAAVGFVAGASILLVRINLVTVVGFLVFYALFNPLQGNTLSSHFYRLIGTLPMKGQLRIESVVMRESFINLGRILSISGLLAFARDLDPGMLAKVLLGGAVTQFALVFLFRHNGKAEEEMGENDG